MKIETIVYTDDNATTRVIDVEYSGALAAMKRSLDPDGVAVVWREIRDALSPVKCINIMGRYGIDERAFVLRTLAGKFKVTVEPLDDVAKAPQSKVGDVAPGKPHLL